MNQNIIPIKLLDCPSWEWAEIDGVQIDGVVSIITGRLTDDITINPDGSYARKCINAEIKHPDYPGIYSLWIHVTPNQAQSISLESNNQAVKYG